MTQIIETTYTLNEFIEQRAVEPIYYQQPWHDLVTSLYGYRIIPLITRDSIGRITGYLPLCLIESFLTGRRLVSFPFVDRSPLLAVDADSANDLITQAVDVAQEQKVKYLELRTGHHDAMSERTDLEAENLYVGWSIPLASDPGLIWKGLQKQVQQKIKKAKKLGVQIEIATRREEVMDFYSLHLKTRTAKHGMPTQPKDFFYALWDTFAARGALQVLLAKHDNVPIGGVVLMLSGDTVKVAYTASDQRYLHLAPNNLLWWEAITWSSNNGYKTIDLGRTARDNSGLMEYKRHWGAVQEDLPYFYYPHVAGLASTSENSWKYRYYTTCWQKLPLSVSGPLGGYLYRHLG